MAADYCSATHNNYIFLDYELNQQLLEDYKTFHSQLTVPIILANNLETGYTKKIGGYTELLDFLEKSPD